MKKAAKVLTVVVDGDVTMDWLLVDLQSSEVGGHRWSSELRSRMCWQRGGAALLADLITKFLESSTGVSIEQREVPNVPVCHGDEKFHHAYTIWRHDDDQAWRVDQFLGVDSRKTTEEPTRISHASSPPRLIVIDDAALGFRDDEASWPTAILEPDDNTWILLKTVGPVATGPLWSHLIRTCPQRLIVVLTVDDLRRTEVQISGGLSWERTAQDVVWEITHNPAVNGLGRCAYAVVSFGTAGVLLHEGGKPAARLIFDPPVMEDEWEKQGQGKMIGKTATLTAVLARALLSDVSLPSIVAALHQGVHATRALHQQGYTPVPESKDGLEIAFPLGPVVAATQQISQTLATVNIQDPVRFLHAKPATEDAPQHPGFWTILQDRYRDGLSRLAESIVINGWQQSLADVPIGRIGLLTTVDRHEIESLHSIQRLMAEYARRSQLEPLSICVFGPPGAGKSFAVGQVAKSVLPGAIESLTFNLSQFDSPDALLGALHQVRDIGLSGRLPLVFWDEFDTPLDGRPLGWLRYFLAPMQDGAFQDGQITHPIGRAIFVFAGGTCATMNEFATSLATDDQRRAAKLPDFVSRLRGFLDILGPNPQNGSTACDPYCIVRRAILLRSLQEREAGHLIKDGRLRIDPGVLQALLRISRFKHGVRSIKAIMSMSQLSGLQRYQRSSLPAESQLNLHVDAREFLSLVQRIVLTDDVTEMLATVAHQVWREGKESTGWTPGESRNEEQKKHPWLIDFADLPEEAKESNRVTVRTIPQKLSRVGYVMIPARSDEPALEFSGDELEELARLEHELWMQAKLESGFRPGSPTDDEPLRNEYLVPWEDVPDEVREADRDLVRGIPRILARAGYAIVRQHDDA